MRKIKPSQLMREAKKYLARSSEDADMIFKNKERFICFALQRAAYDLEYKYDDAWAVSDRLCRKIEYALGANEHWDGNTVVGWLNRQGVDIDAGDIQKYRHRWLNHLIKTFKEAGQ